MLFLSFISTFQNTKIFHYWLLHDSEPFLYIIIQKFSLENVTLFKFLIKIKIQNFDFSPYNSIFKEFANFNLFEINV